MKSSIATTFSKKGVLALFTYEDQDSTIYTDYDKLLHGVFRSLKKSKEFTGKSLTVSHVRENQYSILLIGLGKKNAVTVELFRRAAGIAAKAARVLSESLTIPLLHIPKCSVTCVSEAIVSGVALGDYQFTVYKTVRREEIKSITSLALLVEKSQAKDAKQGLMRGETLAAGVINARDLVNTPPMDLHPASLEAAARKLAKKHKLKCRVFQAKELANRKMGAILAVGKGSQIPPRMIILEYREGTGEPIIFCGKGVCYDSGGYNLKSRMQEDMKDDMGGAAALLGMLDVIATRKVKKNVIVIIGAVENLISGAAYKPGDVVRAMNGKTIEVVNTDAEGRVVLADCLSYASTLKHSSLIDVATLTGAAIVSLGTLAGAVLSPNQDLVTQLIAAGDRSGDRVWQLPLWEDYREDVKSDIADVKNLGYSFYAGVHAGAMLLREFVKQPEKWAHIDMGGPVNEPRERAYIPKGATGWGVRILTEFVEKFTPS